MKESIKFVALALLALAACTPKVEPDPEPEPDPAPVLGESVILTEEAGSSSTVNLNSSAGWTAVSEDDWFSVSPMGGFAGETELTVTAGSANSDIRERVGYFEITVEGEDPVRFYVIQRGARGLELTTTQYTAPGTAGEVEVEVWTNDELTAGFDQNWGEIADVEFGVETTLLDDGTTVSELQKARISLTLEENPDIFNSRSGSLSLKIASGDEKTVPLVQNYREFFRRTLALRFTATWCGYCPMMAQSYENAAEARPERFVPVSLHAANSDIPSDGISNLEQMYRIGGYPSGVVNSVADVQNNDPEIITPVLTGLVDEACTLLPAKTCVSAESAFSGNSLSISGTLATREALPYRVHVYILEDGIIASQTSYSSEYPGGTYYVHDHVQRCLATGTEGILVQGEDKGYAEFSVSYDVPAGRIEDSDNAYAVIFVTYESDKVFEGGVQYVTYRNYGQIVDNVFTIPLNGKIDYEYEK